MKFTPDHHIQSVSCLKKHFSQHHFNVFNELNIYYWIAGGAVRDFFLNEPFNDIDYYFSDRALQERVIKYLTTEKKFTIAASYEHHYTLINDNIKYDICVPRCSSPDPHSTIYSFDYTVACCAIDTNLKFYCHDDFFNDIIHKKLVRLPQSDRYVLTTCKRLRRYLDRGYTIDSENLKAVLIDQERTIENRLKRNRS